MRARIVFGVLLILAGLGIGIHGVMAQDMPPPADGAAGEQAPARAEPAEPASPRSLVRLFIKAYLDGRHRDMVDYVAIPDGMTVSEAEKRALLLMEVLDFHGRIDVDSLPGTDDVEGLGTWELETRKGNLAAAPEEGRWLWTADTLRRVGDIHRRFVAAGAHKYEAFTLRKYMPESLLGEALFLEHWQWLSIVTLLLLAWIAYHVLAFVAHHIVLIILKGRGWGDAGKAAADNAGRPLGYFGSAFIVAVGTPLLRLPLQPLNLEEFSFVVAKFFASFGMVLICYRLADVAGARMAAAAARTDSKLDDQLVPLVRKSIKILVTLGGVLFILDNLHVDIVALLTGMGVAGLGVAFAAKDTIANLFGSVTVFLDRPFQVGDWIQFKGIDGTVEEVGFRSTRLRTFYNSVVSIPNANLVTTEIDNYGLRQFRRYVTRLSIQYDTPPETVEAFCAGIRGIVRANGNMRQDYFHVYLNDFGASGLEVLVYVFFKVPDWGIELRERQNFMVEVLRLARELGVEFAFPTQTLHIASSPEKPLEPRESAPVDEMDALVRRFDRGGDLARPAGTDRFAPGAGGPSANPRQAGDDGAGL